MTAGDAPLYGGLDTIKHADELLAEAERRAAQLWGADWCRFSVAGSTHGNQALALAAGQPGQPIVVTRALHRSLLLGMVLAGLDPVWVLPEVDPATGLPGPVPVAAVRGRAGRAPGRLRGVPRRPVLRRHHRRPGRARRRGAPRPGCRCWWTRPGPRTSASTRTCRRTRWPRARTRMVTSAHKALPAYTQGALVLARTEPAGRATG